MDRMDISINMPRLTYEELNSTVPSEGSENVRKRVQRARGIQTERFHQMGIKCNAHLSGSQSRDFCRLSAEAESLIKSSFRQLKLSARAHDRLLKVARTIADLSGSETVEADHLAEALQYRRPDSS
jgi:magnesium chelatase family protein